MILRNYYLKPPIRIAELINSLKMMVWELTNSKLQMVQHRQRLKVEKEQTHEAPNSFFGKHN